MKPPRYFTFLLAIEPLVGAINLDDFGIGSINDYGCWCRFTADSIFTAGGFPLDEVDWICRQYQYSVQCLLADAAAAEETCDPFGGTHKGLDRGLGPSGLLAALLYREI